MSRSSCSPVSCASSAVSFSTHFPYGILNIHPALLPSFPGLHVQQQALDYGVKFSGCTVHFVDETLDGGPIVLQAVVPVLDDDTAEQLSARILKEEHRIYSEAIESGAVRHDATIDGTTRDD